MSNDIRERAKQILSVVPPLGQQINSVGATADLFTKLTGKTQAQLQSNWDGGGIMTTCNEFVGWFGTQLGSTKYLGRFDIEAELTRMSKGQAWVSAKSGARPKYGDIFRPKKFHMGISLDFEGNKWNTVESGQGGPKSGFDIIKRKQTIWDADALQGWVDLELYFSPAQIGPVPDWLVGWWKVTWRGRVYYYYFDRGREVKWTQTLPQNTSQQGLGPFHLPTTVKVIVVDPAPPSDLPPADQPIGHRADLSRAEIEFKVDPPLQGVGVPDGLFPF